MVGCSFLVADECEPAGHYNSDRRCDGNEVRIEHVGHGRFPLSWLEDSFGLSGGFCSRRWTACALCSSRNAKVPMAVVALSSAALMFSSEECSWSSLSVSFVM